MALIGQFSLFGVNVPNAYAKVISVTGNKTVGWSGSVAVYSTKPADPDPANPTPTASPAQVVTLQTPYIDGEDALTTVYTAAAALPSFAQMTSDVPKNQISRLAFRLRFTAAERQDLLTLAKTTVQVEDWLEQVKDAEYIDLSRADTQGNVNALSGLPSSRNDGTMVLAAGRATTILTP